MTTHRNIASTETQPEAPLTGALMKALALNLVATMEGAAGAPRLLDAAHPTFAAGAVNLFYFDGPGNEITRNAPASGTQYIESGRACMVTAGGLRLSVDMRLSAGGTASVRVLRNGVVLSTLTQTGGSYVTQTVDFTFSVNDVISVETGLTSTATLGYWRNLKLMADQRGVFRL